MKKGSPTTFRMQNFIDSLRRMEEQQAEHERVMSALSTIFTPLENSQGNDAIPDVPQALQKAPTEKSSLEKLAESEIEGEEVQLCQSGEGEALNAESVPFLMLQPPDSGDVPRKLVEDVSEAKKQRGSSQLEKSQKTDQDCVEISARNCSLEKELREKNQCLMELQREMFELQQQLAQQGEKNKVQKQKFEDCQAQMLQLQRAVKANQEEGTNQLQKLHAQLMRQEAELVQYKSALVAVERENEELNNQLSIVEEEKQELQSQHLSESQMLQESQQATEDINASQLQEIEALKAKLGASLKGTQARDEKYQAVLREVSALLKDRELKIIQLEKELENAVSGRDNEEDLKAQISSLQQQLQQKQQELQVQIEKASAQEREAKVQCEELLKTNTQLEKELCESAQREDKSIHTLQLAAQRIKEMEQRHRLDNETLSQYQGYQEKIEAKLDESNSLRLSQATDKLPGVDLLQKQLEIQNETISNMQLEMNNSHVLNDDLQDQLKQQTALAQQLASQLQSQQQAIIELRSVTALQPGTLKDALFVLKKIATDLKTANNLLLNYKHLLLVQREYDQKTGAASRTVLEDFDIEGLQTLIQRISRQANGFLAGLAQ